MISIFLIFYMTITCRMAGGGFGAHILPHRLTWLPEALFSLPFGMIWFDLTWQGVAAGLFAWAWVYAWMQSATAPGLHWGDGNYDPNRTSTLKPFVDWLNNLTIRKWKIGPHYDPSTAAYCRLYMAVKGFLISLPVGGIVLMVLWPLSYEIGYRFRGKVSFDPHAVSELCAGASAALSILIFNAIIQ